MIIYYRLSDKNRRGKAPSYFTNENCLNNFLKYFNCSSDEIILICDNISDETENWIKKYNLYYIKTNYGNSGSFDFSCNHALEKKLNKDEIIYFVENDYLHRENSRTILEEGFKYLNADYVHLYDCPDKYRKHYNINYNNHVNFDENLFLNYKSQIFYGKQSYWRTSNSTTMTFATTYKTLYEDYDMIRANLIWLTKSDEARKIYNYKPIPSDYNLFVTLTEARKRLMISPMPGYCTHGDLLSPHIQWDQYV